MARLLVAVVAPLLLLLPLPLLLLCLLRKHRFSFAAHSYVAQQTPQGPAQPSGPAP
jgi:hypothetical protein